MDLGSALKPDRRDTAVSTVVSVLLHALLLLALVRLIPKPVKSHTVILAVETISGVTPPGSGSGARGETGVVTNTPPNPSPLAGGLRLNVADTAVPKASHHPDEHKPVVNRPPTAAELEKAYANLDIGMKPRQQRAADTLSEGGMGEGKQAGTSEGMPGVTGPLGSRGVHMVDFSYHGNLPEETSLVLLITVNLKGEVVSRRLKQASGYVELDQHVLAKAAELKFDPLPPGAPQVDEEGEIPFRFDYKGHATPGN